MPELGPGRPGHEQGHPLTQMCCRSLAAVTVTSESWRGSAGRAAAAWGAAGRCARSSASCPLRKPCETCETLRNEKPICETLRNLYLRKLAKTRICETLRILRNKRKTETRICETLRNSYLRTCEARFAKLDERLYPTHLSPAALRRRLGCPTASPAGPAPAGRSEPRPGSLGASPLGHRDWQGRAASE